MQRGPGVGKTRPFSFHGGPPDTTWNGGRPPAPRARPGEGLTTLSPATPTSVRSAGQGQDAAVWQGAAAHVLGMNKVFYRRQHFLKQVWQLAVSSLQGVWGAHRDIMI